ncbi:MAG: hypothetical protein ACLQU2_02550 [Candidatus Binataceae bacterium]
MLETDRPGETAALNAIVALIGDHFGEEECRRAAKLGLSALPLPS